MADTSADFKVVIVGGGPVGLITAHCLAKAGIAYEILEKRADNGLNTGTSSALWPQSVRVFDQLDLLDAVYKIQYPSKHKINLLGDGMVLNENDFYLEAGRAHGHPAMFLHRQELVDMLHEHLPGASEHVHFNKQVTAITTAPASASEPATPGQEVTVTCSDGSTYHGSMVIGADGVYSTVRRLMNSKLGLPATGPKSNTEPMKTTYLGIFGSCTPLTIPAEPKLESSESDPDSSNSAQRPMPADSFYETHGPNYALQFGLHHKRTFFGIYHRIPTQPSSGSILPRREPYTEAEKEALAAQYADIHLSPWHTFSDAWENKIWSHMAPLEEGVARIWFSGEDRIVLLGDSVHKHTPISGLGFNAGVQSAVVLTNLLHKAIVLSGRKGAGVTKKELSSVFEQYQKRRVKFATREADLSKLYTRVASWDNLLWKVMDRYILPKINGDTLLLKLVVSKIIKDGEVLDFAEEKNFREGHVKWKFGRVVLPKNFECHTGSEEGSAGANRENEEDDEGPVKRQ